jgi:hypothetical protein
VLHLHLHGRRASTGRDARPKLMGPWSLTAHAGQPSLMPAQVSGQPACRNAADGRCRVVLSSVASIGPPVRPRHRQQPGWRIWPRRRQGRYTRAAGRKALTAEARLQPCQYGRTMTAARAAAPRPEGPARQPPSPLLRRAVRRCDETRNCGSAERIPVRQVQHIRPTRGQRPRPLAIRPRSPVDQAGGGPVELADRLSTTPR